MYLILYVTTFAEMKRTTLKNKREVKSIKKVTLKWLAAPPRDHSMKVVLSFMFAYKLLKKVTTLKLNNRKAILA